MNERMEMFFKKLGEDKEFAEKIFKEENKAEDVQAIAKEAGIELSLDDVMKAKDIIIEVVEKQKDGELSDEDLENVAGGFIITATILGQTIWVTAVTITIDHGW